MIREDQLARTMDSLSRQTLKDFEVILVGDGAPHYEVLDEKIKVIDGPGEAKGSARNKGLESAGYRWLHWLPVYKELQGLASKDCPLSYQEKKKRLQEILRDAKISKSLTALEKHSTLSSFSKVILNLLQRNKLFRAMLLFKIKLS